MLWIKRNLFLVAGGLVSLALLGLAVYYLSDRLDAEQAITEKLTEETSTLNRLLDAKIQPGSRGGVDNIKRAKDQQQHLANLLTQAEKLFPPINVAYQPHNAQEFKELLNTTISQLRNDATNFGVSLESVSTNYDFTFGTQRTLLNFNPTNSILPIATQLAEIQALCEVLFHAKVHALNGLRRVEISKDDDTGASTSPQDYLVNRVKTTNHLAGGMSVIVTPYEVTFIGMKRELQAVLDGLAHAPQFFIVRNIVVNPAGLGVGEFLGPTVPGMPFGSPYRDYYMRRYGSIYGRYYQRPPYYGFPPGMGPAAPTTGPQTVLEEKKLRIRLLVEVVKLTSAR